ncbi:SPOSA6832_02093 [Sporobolomyces salmonicolor]|uniref:SPOSA6832_02093-mRNA-1:cds n=1 Tax=Sporidiobolus salmonicolor TaxID=5005 RepID=A0A0D6EKH3_SPOSA|nr:SPOSA6832_02093 [Sporobolomyces salmonicolor]
MCIVVYSVTPSSLTFEAICTANGYTYPVTTIAAAETSLVWDPWQYAQSPNALPFAQASYTLRVFDERGIQATAQAGLFNGANSIVNFALYSPAAYTPLADDQVQGQPNKTHDPFPPQNRLDLHRLLHLSHPLVVAIPVTAALMLIGGAGVFGR